MAAPIKKPLIAYAAPPVSKASRMSSKVRADTRTPAPKATTLATSRRGGEVKSPRTTPTTKLELARDPYNRAVATAVPPGSDEASVRRQRARATLARSDPPVQTDRPRPQPAG